MVVSKHQPVVYEVDNEVVEKLVVARLDVVQRRVPERSGEEEPAAPRMKRERGFIGPPSLLRRDEKR